jgi:hypothetical protein
VIFIRHVYPREESFQSINLSESQQLILTSKTITNYDIDNNNMVKTHMTRSLTHIAGVQQPSNSQLSNIRRSLYSQCDFQTTLLPPSTYPRNFTDYEANEQLLTYRSQMSFINESSSESYQIAFILAHIYKTFIHKKETF